MLAAKGVGGVCLDRPARTLKVGGSSVGVDLHDDRHVRQVAIQIWRELVMVRNLRARHDVECRWHGWTDIAGERASSRCSAGLYEFSARMRGHLAHSRYDGDRRRRWLVPRAGRWPSTLPLIASSSRVRPGTRKNEPTSWLTPETSWPRMSPSTVNTLSIVCPVMGAVLSTS